MSRKGRPSSSERLQVEQCACIDIKGLPLIEPSCTDEDFVHATLGHSKEIKGTGPRIAELTIKWPNGLVQRVKVPVTHTFPRFGGVRQWFLCPGCQRRVRKLYSPAPTQEFRCRHCYGLVYKSQYWGRNPYFRFFRKLGLI